MLIATIRPVFRPLRTLIGFAFVATMVWCSFNVELGDRTFAEHMDRIGQTEEAQELLRGARSRVRPALDEATQRMLGEYIEAPTATASAPTDARADRGGDGAKTRLDAGPPPLPSALR